MKAKSLSLSSSGALSDGGAPLSVQTPLHDVL